eukprot:355590-Chlamydomonas_euryale.AAC.3
MPKCGHTYLLTSPLTVSIEARLAVRLTLYISIGAQCARCVLHFRCVAMDWKTTIVRLHSCMRRPWGDGAEAGQHPQDMITMRLALLIWLPSSRQYVECWLVMLICHACHDLCSRRQAEEHQISCQQRQLRNWTCRTYERIQLHKHHSLVAAHMDMLHPAGRTGHCIPIRTNKCAETSATMACQRITHTSGYLQNFIRNATGSTLMHWVRASLHVLQGPAACVYVLAWVSWWAQQPLLFRHKPALH